MRKGCNFVCTKCSGGRRGHVQGVEAAATAVRNESATKTLLLSLKSNTMKLVGIDGRVASEVYIQMVKW